MNGLDPISQESLKALRDAGRARASKWAMTQGRGRWLDEFVSKSHGCQEEVMDYDLPHASRISLLDLLPGFMTLTAARIKLAAAELRPVTKPVGICEIYDWTATRRWQRFAAEFMAQAVMEQRQQTSMPIPTLVLEAFAWGSCHDAEDDDDAEHDKIDDLFRHIEEVGDSPDPDFDDGQNLEPLHSWHDVHGAALSSVLRQWAAHGKRSLSIENFEHRLLYFLFHLNESLEPPMLAQLEKCSRSAWNDRMLSLNGVPLNETETQGLLSIFGTS